MNGGTVNMKYIVSYACDGGADFYMTNGYQGRLQYLLAHRHPFFGKASQRPSGSLGGLFVENNETGNILAQPLTGPVISNLTIIGPDNLPGMARTYADSSANFHAASLVIGNGANFQLRNAALLGFPRASFIVIDSNSARNLNLGFQGTSVTASFFQSDDSTVSFLLRKGVYRQFSSPDFKAFMQNPIRENRLLYATGDFQLRDPFNYENPNPLPADGSVLLQGANFAGADYAQSFFDKVSFKGAFGQVNWMDGWVNFTPLKTNYNLP